MNNFIDYLKTVNKYTIISEERFKSILKELEFYGVIDNCYTEEQKQRIIKYAIVIRNELYRYNAVKKFNEVTFKALYKRGLFDFEDEEIKKIKRNIETCKTKIKIFNIEKNKYQLWKRNFLVRILIITRELYKENVLFEIYQNLYDPLKALDLLIKKELKPFENEIKKTRELKKQLEINLMEMEGGISNGSTTRN